MTAEQVVPVAEARRDLSRILRRFREDPDAAEPVVIGSHRKAQAVIAPVDFHWGAARTPIRDEVHRLRDVIEHLARAARLSDVALFGSVARGEAGDASDVDLLVTGDRDADYFDVAQFAMDVEEILGRPVDVVTRGSLSAGHPILAEAVPL